MRFDIITLFPEMFESVMNTSILGRAQQNELLDLNFYNIRDFAANKHNQVDDYSYGGGSGMVLMPQPLFDCFDHIEREHRGNLPKVVYFTPQGDVFNQDIAVDMVREDELILLCGHYEGIDQRVLDTFVDIELSIGDYILTGGELAAMVFIDCISRLIPGVLGNPDATVEESFSNGLLEYPHYTRPAVYRDYKVPDVLLSGNHEEIAKWRKIESLRNTYLKRPDLFEEMDLSLEERQLLKMIKKEI